MVSAVMVSKTDQRQDTHFQPMAKPQDGSKKRVE